jgi:hypothetical protein
MVTIIGSPIEQFGDIYVKRGNTFGYKGILIPIPNLGNINLVVKWL